jgi:hypothetical protein
MTFCHGDRIRLVTTGDDGLPWVRYGFVGGVASESGPVVVMLDGELAGDVVDMSLIEPVTITNVELRLNGADLLTDPDLRHGLVNLWHAETETAGLEIEGLHPIGDGVRDSNTSWTLAELTSGGERYVLRAVLAATATDTIVVRADWQNRWF